MMIMAVMERADKGKKLKGGQGGDNELRKTGKEAKGEGGQVKRGELKRG